MSIRLVSWVWLVGFLGLIATSTARASEAPAPGGDDAPIHVDIDGTWVLDRLASDDLDPVLEAQGVSYLARKLVKGLTVTQVITHTTDVLTIDLHTVIRSFRQTLIVDGAFRTESRADGGSFEASHRWEGTALVTTARGLTRQGEAFETTIRRTLEDGGGSLVQVTEVLRADGQVVTARRVYRRARASADEQPAERITGL